MSLKIPAIFISHGSPMVSVEEDDYSEALRNLVQSLPIPKAIVVVSAHWEDYAPIRVTGHSRPPTIHDFGGFPEELYKLIYPCPGEPALAHNIAEMLQSAGLEAEVDEERGLDHGAWVPLRFLYPKADIPVVQVTLPVPRSPQEIMKIGEALSALRLKGILLMGSGGVVHNLSRVNFGKKYAPVDNWAKEFDVWFAKQLEEGAFDNIVDFRAQAPYANLAVPTTEHFDPIFFILGSAPNENVTTAFEGFHHGNLSMRCFVLRSHP